MRRVVFLILPLFLLLPGCATLFASHADTITIKTEPPGAEVYQGAEFLGTTPLTHTFKRSTFERKTLSIRKAGFKTRELDLSRTLEPLALFNFGYFLTSWGATSWGIDALTGAMIKYDPTSYFIDLERNNKQLDSSDIDRRKRSLFVLLNYDPLIKDISRGDGEYLSAYHSILKNPEPYDAFVRRIQQYSAELLEQADGADLYRYMETHLR